MQFNLAPIYEYFASNWIFRLKPGQGRIALTFDDGPNDQTTPLLIESLDTLKIQATFFLTGEKCAVNKSALECLARKEHLIGNHGFHHKKHFCYGSERQKQSIELTSSVLNSYNIEPALLFRPPYGSFNLKTASVLVSLGYRGILWSVMVDDWSPQTESSLWLKLKNKLHDGAIIVLHDGQKTTPMLTSILPRLSEEVKKRNWKFVKLNSENLSY